MNVCTLIHGYGRDCLPRDVSELAALVDGFRHLEQDLQFRLRLADGVAESEPRGGKAKGRAHEPKA